MPLSCYAIPGRPFHFSDPAFSTHRRKKVIPWGGFLSLLKKPVYNWARHSGSPGSCSLDQEAPFWATFQYPEPEGQEAWQQTSFHAMTHDAFWVGLLTTGHKTTGLPGSLNSSGGTFPFEEEDCVSLDFSQFSKAIFPPPPQP